jgi:hypothetical protein
MTPTAANSSGCVFGYPGNTSIIGGPCITSEACAPLAAALEDGSLNPNAATVPTYGYCTADNGAFSGDSLSRCTSCLQASQGHSYLANCMYSGLYCLISFFISPYVWAEAQFSHLCFVTRRALPSYILSFHNIITKLLVALTLVSSLPFSPLCISVLSLLDHSTTQTILLTRYSPCCTSSRMRSATSINDGCGAKRDGFQQHAGGDSQPV